MLPILIVPQTNVHNFTDQSNHEEKHEFDVRNSLDTEDKNIQNSNCDNFNKTVVNTKRSLVYDPLNS